jgi:hypothetical protein
LKLLELRHGEITHERDRLRSARAAVTGGLGPLPASAAIVLGLAGTVADRIPSWALWITLGLFLTIIAFSILSSRLPPYRVLRARTISREGHNLDDPRLTPAEWLARSIKLEQDIYGRLGAPTKWNTLRPKTLQQGFDLERRALNLVQVLFAGIILVLLLGILLQ